jgi:tyrosyl-tRNA synthetase
MGKSLGNYIGVGEAPYEMFAKVMSIPDDLMREWFELLTDRTAEEIGLLADANQTHPRQAKEVLGKDIVTFYYGEQAAREAAAEWQRRFSERQDPKEIPEAPLSAGDLTDGKIWICKLLCLLQLAKSNNEARRHVEGGAVTLGADKEKVSDPKANVTVVHGLIVRVGNRRVVRVRLGGRIGPPS